MKELDDQKMKKYSKLGLVLITLISSVFFLFYKLRYDRLYNVMQVLEVFGSPSVQERCNTEPLDPPVQGMPPPTWRAVGQHLNVYSAHCTSVAGERGACQSVKIIAIASMALDNSQFFCKLWYEGSDVPIQGTFSSQMEDEGETNLPATLTCDAKYTDRTPYAISLQQVEGELDVVIPVTPNQRDANRLSLSICVLPPPRSDQPSDPTAILLQSLLFHTLVGAPRILVYSGALPHSVLRVAQLLQSATTHQITFRPWYRPLAGLASLTTAQEEKLLALDCYLHNQDAENYIILRQSQLLMPRSATNLSELLQHTNLGVGPNPLQVRRFCSEYPDDKTSATLPRRVLMLQSTYYNKRLSTSVDTGGNSIDADMSAVAELVHTGHARSNLPTHVKTELLVNEYGTCHRYDFSANDKTAVHDKSALKYTKTLLDAYKKYVRS